MENVPEREEERDRKDQEGRGDLRMQCQMVCSYSLGARVAWMDGPVLRINVFTGNLFALRKAPPAQQPTPIMRKSISLMNMLDLWGPLRVDVKKVMILLG